jgi:hypothetical protein
MESRRPSKSWKSRARTLVCALSIFGAASLAQGADPIARPFDPLSFRSQTELLRSFATLKKIIREVPYELYRCLGFLSKDGWTGRALRQNPEVTAVLDHLFAHRLSRPQTFEKMCSLNSQDDYGSMIRTNLGVCAGLTSMTWLANYLAVFDGEGAHFLKFHREFNLPKGHTEKTFRALLRRKNNEWKKARDAGGLEWVKSDLDPEDRQILAFYTPFIDRLFRERQPTVIPFFEDLQTFSGHASLQGYLNKHSLESWFDVNVSFTSLVEIIVKGGRPRKKMRAFEIEDLDRQLSSYLEHRIQPVIFIHLPASSEANPNKLVHVLRVTGVEWHHDKDGYIVHVIDPNFPAGEDRWKIRFENISRQPNDVAAIYEPYEDFQVRPGGGYRALTEVEIMPYFDRMSAQVMKNWAKWLEGEGGAVLDRLEKKSPRR